MAFYLPKNRTICFVVLPSVHLLDLSGAAQVFYEASQFAPVTYSVIFTGPHHEVISEQGLTLSNLVDLKDLPLGQGDYICIPGIDFKTFREGKLRGSIAKIKDWLWSQHRKGIQLATICSGALVLAETGLLDGKKCTTHWKCIEYIAKRYPKINVQTDRLFVKDQNIYTSAGMTAGIDMALAILEEHHGPILPARVAREMVVYMRRTGSDRQQTIYLDYKTHFNPSVHKVQDRIIAQPAKNFTLGELAAVGNTSVRSLTRMFKSSTGHTIVEFKNAVKLELARRLVHNPEYTMERIAGLCGFANVRHLRRLWKHAFGGSPASFREQK